MPSLTIYRTTFDPDLIEDGELIDAETDEEIEDCTPDEYDIEGGITAIDKAVDILTDQGITQPSCSPYPRTGSMTGIWFSYIDGSYCSNYYTGEHVELSAHPEGFTDDEVRTICERINAR